MSEANNESVADQEFVSVPLWFWVVASLALLWNLVGVAAFVAECMMTDEALATQPEDVQTLYRNLPAWYYIAFGIAVIAGAIGCLGLLLRKQWAVAMFALSLFGLAGQQIYQYFLSNTMEVMGPAAVGFQMFVLVVAVALLVLAIKATSNRWLRPGP
jgi:hypothetical protein